jgi:hypothetical protein
LRKQNRLSAIAKTNQTKVSHSVTLAQWIHWTILEPLLDNFA